MKHYYISNRIEDLNKYLLRWFHFKKVPKNKYDSGRCVSCAARHVCGIRINCNASLNQSYQLRGIKTK